MAIIITKTEILFAIIAICATVIPTICDAIAIFFNTKTTIKLEKLKHYETQRITALNDFIDKSHLYFYKVNRGDIDSKETSIAHGEMIKSFLHLQLYFQFDDTTHERLFRTERCGGESDWNFRNDLIVKLSNQINEYIKK